MNLLYCCWTTVGFPDWSFYKEMILEKKGPHPWGQVREVFRAKKTKIHLPVLPF